MSCLKVMWRDRGVQIFDCLPQANSSSRCSDLYGNLVTAVRKHCSSKCLIPLQSSQSGNCLSSFILTSFCERPTQNMRTSKSKGKRSASYASHKSDGNILYVMFNVGALTASHRTDRMSANPIP
jgi:hypothetical protein